MQRRRHDSESPGGGHGRTPPAGDDLERRPRQRGRATTSAAGRALYSFGPGGANAARYAADYHDIAVGSNNIPLLAIPGFDNATGLGTFNGANLLADLTGF